MEKIILLTVPGCQPIIGTVIKEDEEYINVQYPVMLYNEESYLITIPFAPFAKGGLVAFNKNNVICVAAVEDEVKEFYKGIASEMKDSKVTFKKPSESKKQDVVIKHKHLH